MEHDNNRQTGVDYVREQIRREFPDTVFLGKITPVDGRSDDEFDEERDLFEVLSGRKWSDIPRSFLERNPDGFVLLVDNAFVAFLPAWLSFSLTNDEVRELLVYAFSPHVHGSDEWKKCTDRRLRSLAAAQRAVLLEVLKLHLETEPSRSIKEHAQKAVDYVSRFIEEDRAPTQ
jgi:hypothetical protein